VTPPLQVHPELLGLAHMTSVSVYQRRYPDTPRPIIDLGNGRPRLWLRPAVEERGQRTARIASR
jgi:hypothetical protein